MRITARTSGGFAGIARCVELDTGRHADGKAVEALLERRDFFGPAPACPVGADLRRWDITADDGRRCRTVTVAEDDLPPSAAWQTLLDYLRGAA